MNSVAAFILFAPGYIHNARPTKELLAKTHGETRLRARSLQQCGLKGQGIWVKPCLGGDSRGRTK